MRGLGSGCGERSLRHAVAALWLGAVALPGFGQDILTYGEECARRIAPVPAFDCRKGTEALVTVDGRVPAAFQPNMNCDRPALLPYGTGFDGQCVPYSRALVLVDDGRTQIAAFCREKKIRGADTFLYDEIDVIAHSVTNGSTCWFQATGTDPDHPLDGRRVPPPNEKTPLAGQPAAAKFWNPPAKTADEKCVTCHDSDPFMYSPFVAQTGQLPKDPFGKYTNDIGAAFRAWPQPAAVSTAGNTCVGCHRIGNLDTCKTAIHLASGKDAPGEDAWAKRFPNSHWMPAGDSDTLAAWNVIYQESVRKLAACCSDPKAAGCSVKPIGK